MNRSLKTYLRCFAGNQPRCWNEWLHWVNPCYNIVHHSSLGTSQFKAVYKREPPKILRYESPRSAIDNLDKLLTMRDQMLTQLHTNLERAQTQMKTQADKHHRGFKLKVGGPVYLKLRPFHMQSLAWQTRSWVRSFSGPTLLRSALIQSHTSWISQLVCGSALCFMYLSCRQP